MATPVNRGRQRTADVIRRRQESLAISSGYRCSSLVCQAVEGDTEPNRPPGLARNASGVGSLATPQLSAGGRYCYAGGGPFRHLLLHVQQSVIYYNWRNATQSATRHFSQPIAARQNCSLVRGFVSFYYCLRCVFVPVGLLFIVMSDMLELMGSVNHF